MVLKSAVFGYKNRLKMGSKKCFSQRDLRPFGVLKQVFSSRFEPVVTRFGPWTIPKCVENVLSS